MSGVPSRVVTVLVGQVEVELADGQRAVVNAELKPDLAVGDSVLVDRGMVISEVKLLHKSGGKSGTFNR